LVTAYFFDQKWRGEGMEKNNNGYYTKDLYEASFLYARRQTLLGLEKDCKFFWFIFADRCACEKLSTAYWSGNIEVNAKAYSDALRTLKDRVFSQRQEKEIPNAP